MRKYEYFCVHVHDGLGVVKNALKTDHPVYTKSGITFTVYGSMQWKVQGLAGKHLLHQTKWNF